MTDPLFLSADPTTRKLRESHVPPRLSDVALTAKIQAHVPDVPADVVSSPHIPRLLAWVQGTPLPDTRDGDLVIEYIAGQRFFDNFAGGLSAEWVEQVSDGAWAVVDDPTASNGKALKLTGASSTPRVLDFTPAATGIGAPEQIEILSRVKGMYTTSSSNTAIGARMSGAPGAVSGVTLAAYQNVLRLVRFTNGAQAQSSAEFTAPAGSWINLRLRVDGTNVMAKGWVDGDPEPEEWMITATTDLAPGGWTGLYGFLAVEQTWDYVSIATGSLSALPEAEA